MPADFHSPISRAIRPEDTAEALSKYLKSQQRGRVEYALMVQAFYDLITDFYEYGWGRSFHFAPGKDGVSFEDCLTGHQHFLGEAIGLKPGMKVLDIGCGVGGPQRSIARKFGASIVGLNISEYQIGKCATYARKEGLEDICSVLHGDFMDIPAEDGSFDAAYHIEAIAHAPDKTAAYAEAFRILRPGAFFAGYDWCMTPLYDDGNPEHREIRQGIEYGNALPQIASFADITDGLRACGFEAIEARDRAPDADPETPWYRPLEGRCADAEKFAADTSRPQDHHGRPARSGTRTRRAQRIVGDIGSTQRGGRQPRGRRAPGDIHAHVLPQGAQAGMTWVSCAVTVEASRIGGRLRLAGSTAVGAARDEDRVLKVLGCDQAGFRLLQAFRRRPDGRSVRSGRRVRIDVARRP